MPHGLAPPPPRKPDLVVYVHFAAKNSVDQPFAAGIRKELDARDASIVHR
jgi:hypothetical protein